jgi:hypothetical protein
VPVTYTIQGDLLRLDLVGQYEPNDIILQFLEGLRDPRRPGTVALLLALGGTLFKDFTFEKKSCFLGLRRDAV